MFQYGGALDRTARVAPKFFDHTHLGINDAADNSFLAVSMKKWTVSRAKLTKAPALEPSPSYATVWVRYGGIL